MRRIEQVAPTNATVLLLGETGTGKSSSLAIHQHSPRRHRSFIVVDCGRFPRRSSTSFSGASGRIHRSAHPQAGRFRAREWRCCLPRRDWRPAPRAPTKILRVLQEGQVERLGANRTTRVDVRVVTATNRNLADDVGAAGSGAISSIVSTSSRSRFQRCASVATTCLPS